MTKREIYNGIVAEVEADRVLVSTDSLSYEDVVANDTISISIDPSGVSLKSPISAFSDYAVRDSLMIRSCDDEVFALILTCKVGKHVDTKISNDEPLDQNDIEALAMSAQITAMWEQFSQAQGFLEWISEYSEKNSLKVPALAKITANLLDVRNSFPFADTRRTINSDIGDKTRALLDE